MFSHVNVWCFMKPKGAYKQRNAYATCNIRRAIPEEGEGHGDFGSFTVKTGQAYPPRFYSWIDYLKNESVSRSRN